MVAVLMHSKRQVQLPTRIEQEHLERDTCIAMSGHISEQKTGMCDKYLEKRSRRQSCAFSGNM